MKTWDIEQGTQEWLDMREKYFTASNAPAMMGDGYDSRSKSLEYALGISEKKITPFMQAMFDEGHEKEDAARGSSFKPAVGTLEVDGLSLMASFDGLSDDLVWEHKHTSKKFEVIPALYYWQLEHQLLVAGMEQATLTVTDRATGEIRDYDYTSSPERRQDLISGWKRWSHDLLNYGDRIDAAWFAAAEEYISIKAKIDKLTDRQKFLAKELHAMAGTETTRGGGVKVNVITQTGSKQTAAAYIKENGIELPVTELDEPKITYRITLGE